MSAPFEYERLGYVVLGTPHLDESIGFYRDLMGLELCDYQSSTLATFRCSDKHADFVLLQHQEAGVIRIGMQVKSAEELEKARVFLSGRGYTPVDTPKEQRERVRVGPGFTVVEPQTGLTFDFFDSYEKADRPFTPTVTDIQRLGHIVLRAQNLESVWQVLEKDFNFVASDYVENKAVWLRCYPNPLHHTIAVVKEDQSGLHHVNFMVSEIDDIGAARNRLMSAGVNIEFGPGRHEPSGSVFLYFNDPAGMTMEFSYGMEEFPVEGARQPRALENSARTMDKWGGVPQPTFAKSGEIIDLEIGA